MEAEMVQRDELESGVEARRPLFGDDEEITIEEVPEEAKSTSDYKVLIYGQFGMNYIQLSSTTPKEIPCCLSFEAQDISESIQTRPGVDIVCVIDKSGSMNGAKIDLVKQSLNFLVQKLSDKDRICLITFNGSHNRLCPLTVTSREGKTKLSVLINSIRAGGGTNIVDGLQCGIQVLADRQRVNKVSSILLLSDGMDSSKKDAIERAHAAIISQEVASPYSIHTLGYGDNHDVDLLNSIAQAKNGGFYYVKDVDTIAEAFSFCLGELISVVADQFQVNIVPQECDIPFSVGKFYTESGDSSFKIPPLLSGDKKEAVFLLAFPPTDTVVPENHTVTPIKGTATYQLVKTGETVEYEFSIPIRVENEEFKGEIEVDQDVLINFYRVKTADVLKQAIILADNEQYEPAKDLLRTACEELLHSIVASHEIVQVLVSDITECARGVENSQNWRAGGKHRMMEAHRGHLDKRMKNVKAYKNAYIRNMEDDFKMNLKK